ncbi:MAG: hypothetical protein EBR09_15885 [Proteobacteria bacterium]|nr:hypothetical protein [Pseudomonadota bacterium]
MFQNILKIAVRVFPILFIGLPALAQDNPPDPSAFKFLRTKTVTDMVCGSTANTGSGPQCGEPSLTWNAASTAACRAIQAQDSRCPVAEYFRGRSPDCGAELYRVGTSNVCGTEPTEFWSGWDESCPAVTVMHGIAGPISVPMATGESEYRVHRVGFSVSVQERKRCKGQAPKTCRHPDFGTEVYSECNLGVKSYQACTVGYETCRHPSHGEESRTYPTCKNETFGVSPNTCIIPDLAGQQQSIGQFADEISAYKFILETLMTAGQSLKSIMTSTLMVLESTVANLSGRETDLKKQIAAETSAEKIKQLRVVLAEVQANIAELRETAEELNQCAVVESVCSLNSESIKTTFENQLRRAQNDLGIIRNFLQNEAERWKSTSDSLYRQIIEILNSPSMKESV